MVKRKKKYTQINSEQLGKELVKGLEKSLKKYHGTRGSTRSPSTKGATMARKKSRTRRVYVKARRARRSGSGSFSLQKLILPIGAATVAEPILDTYLKQLPIPKIGPVETDDLAKIAIGWYFGKKGGMIGNVAKMLGIFGMRNTIAGVTGNVLGGQTQDQSW